MPDQQKKQDEQDEQGELEIYVVTETVRAKPQTLGAFIASGGRIDPTANAATDSGLVNGYLVVQHNGQEDWRPHNWFNWRHRKKEFLGFREAVAAAQQGKTIRRRVWLDPEECGDNGPITCTVGDVIVPGSDVPEQALMIHCTRSNGDPLSEVAQPSVEDFLANDWEIVGE